LINPISGDSLI